MTEQGRQIGAFHRSATLRASFERAIEQRTTVAALRAVQRDYAAARLRPPDVWRLDELVTERLRKLELELERSMPAES